MNRRARNDLRSRRQAQPGVRYSSAVGAPGRADR